MEKTSFFNPMRLTILGSVAFLAYAFISRITNDYLLNFFLVILIVCICILAVYGYLLYYIGELAKINYSKFFRVTTYSNHSKTTFEPQALEVINSSFVIQKNEDEPREHIERLEISAVESTEDSKISLWMLNSLNEFRSAISFLFQLELFVYKELFEAFQNNSNKSEFYDFIKENFVLHGSRQEINRKSFKTEFCNQLDSTQLKEVLAKINRGKSRLALPAELLKSTSVFLNFFEQQKVIKLNKKLFVKEESFQSLLIIGILSCISKDKLDEIFSSKSNSENFIFTSESLQLIKDII